jgi:carbonic anhydrase/acetyltransferase-like protein (isoleucine patch superfamily)
MGATVLDGAVIGRNSILGAQSLVVKGTHIPEGSLALGTPAKVVRKLSAQEIEEIAASATRYIELGSAYRTYFHASGQ